MLKSSDFDIKYSDFPVMASLSEKKFLPGITHGGSRATPD